MVVDIIENMFMQSQGNASHLFLLLVVWVTIRECSVCFLPCWPVSIVIKALFMYLAKWKGLSRAVDHLPAAIDNNTNSMYIRLFKW